LAADSRGKTAAPKKGAGTAAVVRHLDVLLATEVPASAQPRAADKV
jgi:hypothetical protein